MTFTDDDLRRLEKQIEDPNRFPLGERFIEKDIIKALLARLEAAEMCASCLDAHSEAIEENSDEDDIYIMKEALEAWHKVAGK